MHLHFLMPGNILSARLQPIWLRASTHNGASHSLPSCAEFLVLRTRGLFLFLFLKGRLFVNAFVFSFERAFVFV